MQSPLPQITTFLLLVHMGFGCCWHHEHTHAVVCGGAHPARGVTTHDDHDGMHGEACHADEAAHRQAEHLPHEPGDPHSSDCDDTHCVFLRIDQTSDLQGGTCVGSTFLAAVALSDDLPIHALSGHGLDALRRVQGPGLRAHLAFQVMLI